MIKVNWGSQMNYKMTSQYARGEEKLIAAFNDLNEARFFMAKKSSVDDEERRRVIYRIYDDQELLYELNKEGIAMTHAKYAEGNGDLNNTTPFIFQVLLQTITSLERETIAQFKNKTDASLFVACKIEADDRVHDNDLFFIYKGKILIDTINKTIIANRKTESGGNPKGYHLSPLSTRPTPGGGPADYWVETKDDDENI